MHQANRLEIVDELVKMVDQRPYYTLQDLIKFPQPLEEHISEEFDRDCL